MDYPKHIDTITMDYSIIYFKGVRVKMSKKVWIILANSTDSGKMPPQANFRLWVFYLCQFIYLLVTRMNKGIAWLFANC